MGSVTVRIGRGAGPNGLNLQVIPMEQRVDFDASKMVASDIIAKAMDVFATQDGSWEYKPEARYGIGLAERVRYMRSPDDPYHCDDFGAERHILTVAVNKDDIPLPGAGFVLSSDGPQWLQREFDPTHVTMGTGKAGHGWYNLPMGEGSAFSPPEHGPWSVAKLATKGASDIVTGMGLPDRWHVASYIVFELMTWGEYMGLGGTLEEKLQAEGDRLQAIQFNPRAALQRAMFAAGFVPNSPEYSVDHDGTKYVAQRSERLDDRVVRYYFCPAEDYGKVHYYQREGGPDGWDGVYIEGMQ